MIQKSLKDQYLRVECFKYYNLFNSMHILLTDKLSIRYIRGGGPGGQNINKCELITDYIHEDYYNYDT